VIQAPKPELRIKRREEFKVKPSNLSQEQRKISTSTSQTAGVSFWALLVGRAV
jgi:hypothetical protein